ncbi:hypothetical protein PG997_007010 [Apiospora hydei]|uniref:C2H2-type domain-containing protein n=1 Tax=Apiospora hydei TaxID=1337664 RepID=A0ABR1WQC9_9PEZI
MASTTMTTQATQATRGAAASSSSSQWSRCQCQYVKESRFECGHTELHHGGARPYCLLNGACADLGDVRALVFLVTSPGGPQSNSKAAGELCAICQRLGPDADRLVDVFGQLVTAYQEKPARQLKAYIRACGGERLGWVYNEAFKAQQAKNAARQNQQRKDAAKKQQPRREVASPAVQPAPVAVVEQRAPVAEVKTTNGQGKLLYSKAVGAKCPKPETKPQPQPEIPAPEECEPECESGPVEYEPIPEIHDGIYLFGKPIAGTKRMSYSRSVGAKCVPKPKPQPAAPLAPEPAATPTTASVAQDILGEQKPVGSWAEECEELDSWN